MKAEFDKEPLPICCEGCNKQGYIFVDNFERNYFFKCSKCGREGSEVVCPECGTGGDFVEKIADRPVSWSCPECKRKYSLSLSFYKDPKTLYLEEGLPKEVLEKVMPEEGNHFGTFALIFIFGSIIFVLFFVIMILLNKALS